MTPIGRHAGQAWTASHDLVNKMRFGLDPELLKLVDVDELTLLIFVGSYYHTNGLWDQVAAAAPRLYFA